jgi:hypothetical protein
LNTVISADPVVRYDVSLSIKGRCPTIIISPLLVSEDAKATTSSRKHKKHKGTGKLLLFISNRDSRCDECGEQLGRGAWIQLQ